MPGGSIIDTGPCRDGATRDCSVTLGRQGRVLSCYHGTQTCNAGAWGRCENGTSSTLELAASAEDGGVHTLAYSASARCLNNPCDPFCNDYIEQPPTPVIGTLGPKFEWSTGSLANLPKGLVSKGLKEPCGSAFDCQFNQYCSEPITASSCSHSKCEEGGALIATCDSCVNDICATNPSCCTQPSNACSHDTCTVGSYLKAGCTSCVDKVCAKRSSCCSKKGSWDSSCVDLAVSECGVSCPCQSDEIVSADKSRCYFLQTSEKKWADALSACTARGTGWNLVTINDSSEESFLESRIQDDTWIGLNANAKSGNYVWSSGQASTYRNWHRKEPDGSGDCVYLDEKDADWHDTSCTQKYQFMCEGPAASASGGGAETWDQSCVDAVKSVCGASCGSGSPPASQGKCTPWLPGQTDTSCDGIDLAVGVPCDNTIPVCNHGTKDAPAGIKLVHFPANSQQFPNCNPSLSHPQMKTCTTKQAIPAGQCISVTDCAGLTGNREIMVNPQSISGYVTECNCRDNWSLYSGGSCGAPACSGSTSVASFRPVKLFIMFDKSGSMSTGLSGGGTRWSATSAALSTFFKDPGSAGLGVAFRFFPDDKPSSGCNDNKCSAAACSDPLVELGVLTSAGSPSDTQEKLLLNAVSSTSPGGWTPTFPALDGALDWATSNQMTDPSSIYAVVLVTDGQPSKCNTDWKDIRQLATDAYENYGVRTYAIGIQGSNISDLDLLAKAGGTGSAFVATASNAAQMQADLVDALQSIAGQNVSCTFALPTGTTIDSNNVSVVYTPGTGGATQTLPKVQGSSSCGSGWYFDDNTTPKEITLCPTTCSAVQADKGALVETQLGCPSTYGTSQTSQIYEASCAAGSAPQWNFLTYNTTTPADSSVEFRARAANTKAGLSSAPAQLVATARLSPTDLQRCTESGPKGCPINLFKLLGASARLPFLQLDLTVNPTSDKLHTATANDWKVTYSCPPSE